MSAERPGHAEERGQELLDEFASYVFQRGCDEGHDPAGGIPPDEKEKQVERELLSLLRESAEREREVRALRAKVAVGEELLLALKPLVGLPVHESCTHSGCRDRRRADAAAAAALAAGLGPTPNPHGEPVTEQQKHSGTCSQCHSGYPPPPVAPPMELIREGDTRRERDH
jgi:transposase